MKTQKHLLSFCAILLAALSLVSCHRETVSVSEFIPYISAYTSGLVYPSSTIRIELADGQKAVDANTEVSKDLFSFSPSVKGKAYWVNDRTIEFVPEAGSLKSGQIYEVQFKLGKVTNVDKRLKVFPYNP